MSQIYSLPLGMPTGTLYLLPVPLADGAEVASYTPLLRETIGRIDEYVVENEKTARRFLRAAGLNVPQSALKLHDYGKHAREKADYGRIFESVVNGKDIGLMSEAGCPGVADPGADIVAEAHRRGVRVVPLVGPSAILLALMASGFNGQRFAFHGYLPIAKGERAKAIKDLERQSARDRQTQVFIETPFRNDQLFEELLRNCAPGTKICVACNLTAKDEFVLSLPVSEWKKRKPELHKKPAMFLMAADEPGW